jgi:hypothetical protein
MSSVAASFSDHIHLLPLRFRPVQGASDPVTVHVATTGPEPGNWLIAIDAERCRVFDGSLPEPDARVFTCSEVGQAILQGSHRLGDAIESRLLDYEGDVDSLRVVAASLGLRR